MDRHVESPRSARLPGELASAARACARRLGAAGESCWIVGGAVRDLALGARPDEIDLTTSALPERLLQLFPASLDVGKAFGTVVVRPWLEAWTAAERGADGSMTRDRTIEVTTLRRERGYSDRRRPDEVEYTTDPAEDANRRDFTINALYLDPLTDVLFDPAGGLADLRAGRLACVGSARARFAEDGLRVWRLVRFAARLALVIDDDTRRAAREAIAAGDLAGVSAERRTAELHKILDARGGARGLRLALELGLWPLPEARASGPLAALIEALDDPPGTAAALATLFLGDDDPTAARRAHDFVLEVLRGSRELAARTERIVAAARDLPGAASAARSARLRLARAAEFPAALALARGLARARGASTAALEALAAERAAAAPEDLWPEPWLTSADLAALGLPRGPRWGELLRAAEDLRLDGQHATREQAVAWLAAAVAQDGGNARRNE